MADRKPEGDLIGDVRDEVTGMLKGGMGHPSTRPVLTGAAVGLLAGVLLPVVTWPIGLAAGAGYALYKRVR